MLSLEPADGIARMDVEACGLADGVHAFVKRLRTGTLGEHHEAQGLLVKIPAVAVVRLHVASRIDGSCSFRQKTTRSCGGFPVARPPCGLACNSPLLARSPCSFGLRNYTGLRLRFDGGEQTDPSGWRNLPSSR